MNKGVVTADESTTPALYYPVPADALIARLKSGYDTDELENDLDRQGVRAEIHRKPLVDKEGRQAGELPGISQVEERADNWVGLPAPGRKTEHFGPRHDVTGGRGEGLPVHACFLKGSRGKRTGYRRGRKPAGSPSVPQPTTLTLQGWITRCLGHFRELAAIPLNTNRRSTMKITTSGRLVMSAAAMSWLKGGLMVPPRSACNPTLRVNRLSLFMYIIGIMRFFQRKMK